MPAKNSDLALLLNGLDEKTLKVCYEFFREKLYATVYQAPLSYRVLSKPLGYAGDYEMMNLIYRSQPEGHNLFAKCMHNYWLRQPAAQAVRNRAKYLVNKIGQIIDANSNKSDLKPM